jgi:hypothetical protein
MMPTRSFVYAELTFSLNLSQVVSFDFVVWIWNNKLYFVFYSRRLHGENEDQKLSGPFNVHNMHKRLPMSLRKSETYDRKHHVTNTQTA